MEVALLTAGKDPHYALGLAPALADAGIELELVGNSDMEKFPGVRHSKITFFNLRGDQRAEAALFRKICRILVYYARLVRFSWQSRSDLFHILWPNKFVYFDRTLLNIYYRALGKKLVFTAHNVNTEARDQRDSAINRLTLKIQYRLMHHVFVHTQSMKSDLTTFYGVPSEKVTVVTFPVNNVTPNTCVTREDARKRLQISPIEKTILFFGNIAPYKGLEDLIRALPVLRRTMGSFRVLVVGSVKSGEREYFEQMQELIRVCGVSDLVDQRIEYLPEDQVELYFKAADLLVLPYRRIFQSGVLLLSYGFGLPVVAADSGSLREEIIEGETGFVCRQSDPADLADKIYCYFNSPLFAELDTRRSWIIRHANEHYSWERLAAGTCKVYERLVR
jgi:glycosyltransferase involved in cell wall biosynthesis